MNWEVKDLFSDLEVVKDRLVDLHTTHRWSGDSIFTKPRLETKEDRINYSYSYLENRIQHEQHGELLLLYVEELSNLIDRFNELDKKETLSATDQSTDNADK
ncbi:type II toxin-antitoxin system toxin TscT [Staphylococcus sp. Marseille-Q1834]|uniref:type II toxin-antitoxin system toxin TscT n=1 Tax=Staphylococcus sp. Marseille-Q1834 TaxID=2866594 RepID=UPI001CF8CBEB|nr:DUF1474 family protein [Staphylococcus sp. Marseille-Q1834]